MQSIQFDQAEIIELIDEVSKQKPNQNRIKNLVKKYDIQFSKDPIEQMALVLQKIDLRGLGKYSKSLDIKDSVSETRRQVSSLASDKHKKI